MMEAPVLTAAELRQNGRDIAAPFVLRLKDGTAVWVQRVLRNLPGRRLVAQAEGAGEPLLLKLFLDPIRAGAECAREAKGLQHLTGADIPTQEGLIQSHTLDGAPVLLTRYFPQARTLYECIVGAPTDGSAPRVVCAAFALLGKLHQAGLVHHDLHLNNLLEVGAGETAPALRLLDGDAIRTLPGDGARAERARMENLGLFGAQFLPAQWRNWQAASLAAYAQGLGRAAGEEAQIAVAVSAARARRLRHYLKKCARECTEFAMQRDARRLAVVRREEQAVLQAVLVDPDAWMARGEILKDGATCTVTRLNLGARTVVIKRYNIKNLGHGLSRAWRPSRAWHSWINGHRLQFHGVATPRPLAVIEERLGPLRRRAWLITEWQPGERLDQFIQAHPDALMPSRIEEALINVLRELRAARLVHGDMKASNFLWDGNALTVIDLDAMTVSPGTRYESAWRKDHRRLLANWAEGSPARRALEQRLQLLEGEPG